MRAFLQLAAMALAGGILSGCVEISGGAVEARWELRGREGGPLSCSEAGVASVRFSLQQLTGEQDVCQENPSCIFSCERGIGMTGFIIPEGRYLIALQPLDTGGELLLPARGVVTPSPVVRDVRTGELTDLSVNMIIVSR